MNLKSLFKSGSQEELLNNHPDGVVIINFNKQIVFWNRRCQEIFGYTRKEAIGQNINFIIDGGIEQVYRALSKEKSAVISINTKTGHQVFVEITASDSQEGDKIIISIRNVTQRQNLLDTILDDYEKTKKASKDKNQFIAELSHELKTPMHSIIGFSQALSDGLGGELSEKQEKYISIISRNANRLLSLLNSIIDIAKLESGKIEFKYKNIDINNVILAVKGAISPYSEEKRLSFTIDTEDLVKKICYTDELMLKEALMHLLDNAVRYTDSGSVRLKISHPDLDFVNYHKISIHEGFTDKSYLLFSITDTGAGIPNENLDAIFEEYKKAENTLKKSNGAGLGLSITRKIIEELGGSIWVESELLQGSTFNFIVPVDKPKPLQGDLI